MDNDFLHDTAEALLRRKEVLKVPVMMGITNHEFGWILPQVALQVNNSGHVTDPPHCFSLSPNHSCPCVCLGIAEFCTPRVGERHEQGVCASCYKLVQSRGEFKRKLSSLLFSFSCVFIGVSMKNEGFLF